MMSCCPFHVFVASAIDNVTTTTYHRYCAGSQYSATGCLTATKVNGRPLRHGLLCLCDTDNCNAGNIKLNAATAFTNNVVVVTVVVGLLIVQLETQWQQRP